MKKGVLLFVVLLFASSAFAVNIELDENLVFLPYDKLNLSFDETNFDTDFSDATMRNRSFFGLELSPTFFFFAPLTHLDIGVNLNLGFSVIAHEFKDLPDEPGEAYGSYVFASVGPCFRWNFNETNSLSFISALRYNIKDVNSNPLFIMMTITGAEYESLYLSRYRSLAFTLAYKHWFVNTERVHFGLNGGVDFNIPLDGTFAILYGDREPDAIYYKTDGGAAVKVFIGVCLNFGKRSLEQAKIIEEERD